MPKLSDRYRFSYRIFGRTRGNGRDAPKAVVRPPAGRRLRSGLIGSFERSDLCDRRQLWKVLQIVADRWVWLCPCCGRQAKEVTSVKQV